MIIPPSPAKASAFRLKRGTKSSAVASHNVAELPPLSAIDGPFQLAEYLALKVRADPHNVAGLVEVPAEGRSTDRDVWIYEHLRRLPIDLTPLVSQLLTHCTKETCPEMKADQWQYLCVAHGSGVSEECCAIDYILHTLCYRDLELYQELPVKVGTSASAHQASTDKLRMSIPPGSLSHFPSLSRRLSRIFSHAYFHHREQFLLSESETSLYARFVALCEAYGLVGKELLIIPHAGKAEAAADEEENGDDDEAADGDDDDEGDEPSRPREKEKSGGKRTLSLDRQSGVGFKMLSREKGKGKVTQAEADAEGSSESAKEKEVESIPEEAKSASPPSVPTSLLPKKQAEEPKSDSAASGKKAGTLGRGTMGRGKQNRGTMLWSSDSPEVPAVPQVPMLFGGQALERTESRESVIYLGDEGNQEAEKVPEAVPDVRAEEQEEEPPVPKDEIELLEEAGKLEVEPTVSPLPPPSETVNETKAASTDPPSSAEVPETSSNDTTDPEEPTSPVKSVSFIEEPKVIPTPSPKSTPAPVFPPTAATSPLNPPRSLSRSPEARHKALSGTGSSPPSRKSKEGSKSPAGSPLLGLPKIEKKEEGDALDAEGSQALPPDVPERTGSPVVVKKGEGKEADT